MYNTLSDEPKGTAWLIATGSLTNVAALFREHPDLCDHVAGLSIMGGAIGGGFTDAQLGKVEGEGERFGNHTPFAEFNIYCDPEAAHAVLSHPVLASKTILIPLDVTHLFLATSDVRMGLLFGPEQAMQTERTMASVTTVRRLFFEILMFFAKTYADVFGLTAGPPTHDPLAVAVAFRPDLFTFKSLDQGSGDRREHFAVSVVLQGEHGDSADIRNSASQCGRTVATPQPLGSAGALIPRGLDTQSLWAMIEGCLQRAELASQKQPSMKVVSHSPHMDFASLVSDPQITLSQVEQAAGLPDIHINHQSPRGDFLHTEKSEPPRDIIETQQIGAAHSADQSAQHRNAP
jgi:uridine nucleosidase